MVSPLRPALALLATALAPLAASAVPLVEHLGRGLVATQQSDGKVFLSWRLLADDPADIAFNVYRTTEPPAGAKPIDFGIFASTPDTPAGTVKLNAAPLTDVTWFSDSTPGLHYRTTMTQSAKHFRRIARDVGRRHFLADNRDRDGDEQ